VVLTCVSALGGCAAPAEAPSTPSASLTPQDQDEATFRSLYSGYVDLPLDTETVDDLRSFLTGTALSSDVESLEADHQSGHRTVGRDTVRGFEVTDRGSDAQGGAYMDAQACLDVSGTRVLDASGADITPERDELVSLQMKAVKIEDGSWRISDFVRNDGVRACG
jgi:hypothetical protein